VGPSPGLEWVQKISPSPGFDPRTVQPVANHYTGPYTFRYTVKHPGTNLGLGRLGSCLGR